MPECTAWYRAVPRRAEQDVHCAGVHTRGGRHDSRINCWKHSRGAWRAPTGRPRETGETCRRHDAVSPLIWRGPRTPENVTKTHREKTCMTLSRRGVGVQYPGGYLLYRGVQIPPQSLGWSSLLQPLQPSDRRQHGPQK